MDALVGTVLAIMIAIILATSIYRYERSHAQYNEAHILGHQIANYMNGAEERMTVDANLEPGTYLGSAWLKSKVCGGVADKNYLPCHFKIASTLLRAPLSIKITRDSADRYKYDAHLSIGPVGLISNGTFEARPALAGAIINAAKSYFIENTNQFISASSTYALDRKKSLVSIDIMANQINGNIFVRRDGTTDMEANFTYDPALPDDHRQLVNVSNVHMSGNNNTISATRSLNLNASGNMITQNEAGTFINDPQSSAHMLTAGPQQTVYLGNQSGVKGDSNVTVNDMRIHSMGDQLISNLLTKSQLGQYDCYQTGNAQGRDFNPHMCKVGYYVAGLKFNGHNDHESSYVWYCCSPKELHPHG